jgi:hypothetical protein
MPSAAITEQLTRALGEAVIRIWSDLPQDVQDRPLQRGRCVSGRVHKIAPFSFTIIMSGLPIPWATRAR